MLTPGIKLCELAALVGLSQTDIAKQLDLHHAQINRWARGVRPVPQRYRKALTDFVFQAASRRITELRNQPSLADAADPEHGPRATALDISPFLRDQLAVRLRRRCPV
jgi:hypothetical protein